jgi:Zn finger protein HypA/HybF involved in hydrogenase expression
MNNFSYVHIYICLLTFIRNYTAGVEKVKFRIKKEELTCETCGAPLSEDNIYVRVIKGEKHYFCCSHCADAYEAKLK